MQVYQLGFPSLTEVWLSLDNYGPVPSHDTYDSQGLLPGASLGHPTFVLKGYFHFAPAVMQNSAALWDAPKNPFVH